MHRSFGVEAKLIHDLGPPAVFSGTPEALHRFELCLSVSDVLLGVSAGLEDFAAPDDHGPVRLILTCRGEEGVQDRRISSHGERRPLSKRVAHQIDIASGIAA